jgi:hypothetical protein
MITREEEKASVLLYLAGCGIRDGLNEQQQAALDQFRLNIAYAYEANNDATIKDAKTALLNFYKDMYEIKNGENIMTVEQATASDAQRLEKAAKEYNPNHQHPNYRR